MNRFSNYLSAQRLAKAELTIAKKALYSDRDQARAIHKSILALEYMMTAMNNVASLAFEPRKKR